MPTHAQAPAPWSVVERASFLVGRCDACAWTSPARRARYSVVTDMRAHEVLCRSAAEVDERLAAGADVQADVHADVVASGRERLSAQGRS
jgi:hypothetical protein